MKDLLIGFLLSFILVLCSPTAEVALNPVVKVNKTELIQGDLFVIEVENSSTRPKGSFLSQEINFFQYQGKWSAIVGISYWVDPGTYPLIIYATENEKISYSISIFKGNFKESYLQVSKEQERKVKPDENDQEILIQKERDKELLQKAYTNGELLPLWDEPFVCPTKGQVTGGFGDTRYVNGVLYSRHSGLDIANLPGTSILAVNTGVVRLAAELLVTGKTVVIDHGGGLYSSYSHLEEILVKNGDRVERGQVIGKMGSTGFSTGSHLHWVMKSGDVYLNPEIFIENDPLREVNIGLK